MTTTQCRTLVSANMRQEPSANAAVAATLKQGAIIHVDMSRNENGWFPVQVVNGWMSGELFEVIGE